MLQDVLINLKQNTQNSKKSNLFTIFHIFKTPTCICWSFFILNLFQDLIKFNNIGVTFQVKLSTISFLHPSENNAVSIAKTTVLPTVLKH
jgi:hypothetical protein